LTLKIKTKVIKLSIKSKNDSNKNEIFDENWGKGSYQRIKVLIGWARWRKWWSEKNEEND
jgi:hypothetical protein